MMSRLMLNLRDPKIASTMTTVATACGNPMALTAVDPNLITETIDEEPEFECEVTSPIGTSISV